MNQEEHLQEMLIVNVGAFFGNNFTWIENIESDIWIQDNFVVALLYRNIDIYLQNFQTWFI